MEAVDLRVEYRRNPSGIDSRVPRLSWQVQSPRAGARQTAYHVLVATKPSILENGVGDLWNSGVIASADQNHVAFAGQALHARMQCFWKVRVWDERDHPGPFSEPATWTMGLLHASDWRARWIGYDTPRHPLPERLDPWLPDDCEWVGATESEPTPPAPEKVYRFRKRFMLTAAARIESATAVIASGDQFRLHINGHYAGESDGRHNARFRPSRIDVRPFLILGANTMTIEATHTLGDAGVMGKIRVEFEAGDALVECIDGSWQGSVGKTGDADWRDPDYDTAAWSACAPAALHDHIIHGTEMAFPDGIVRVPPAPLLRHEFTLEHPPARATLYITALGLYEAHLNGTRVSEDLFSPGWTDFNKRVYYQTYDVTPLLREGPNAIGVVLAAGWYSGYIGGGSNRHVYGKHPRLLLQLEITNRNGDTTFVLSDETWKATHGPHIEADIYMGSTYDAREYSAGWLDAGFDAGRWDSVVCSDPSHGLLQAMPHPPVRRMLEVRPVSIHQTEPGSYVFDLGQNIVGWARIRATGEAGTQIRMRYAEICNSDGSLYVKGLRAARSTDTYIIRGLGEETWEPSFTFHGFRYIEVTGYPGQPTLDDVMGIVVHSGLERTGQFECSNPDLNRLYENVLWSQRGNFLEIPTDCPQRDERLGWTGDIRVFARTASYTMDTATFLSKWVQDLVDTQRDDGAIADVAPLVMVPDHGAPGWADACVTVPWDIYVWYGDTEILHKHYGAMQRWFQYVHEANPDGLRRERVGWLNYGDWVAIDDRTPKDLVATALYFEIADLLARIAGVIGKPNDQASYAETAEFVKKAFAAEFIDDDGRIAGDTQTSYAMALHYGLVPDSLTGVIAERFLGALERAGWRLTTGFLGTPLLLPVLDRIGRTDLAYRVLLQEECPSWLFPVKHGATTIWERWNAWTPEQGPHNDPMVSFNHYAFGAVAEWMYRRIGGIAPDERAPGFRHIQIAPVPGGRLTHARCAYRSIRGPIESRWSFENSRFVLDVAVPPNSSATIDVPTTTAEPTTAECTGRGAQERLEPIARGEGVDTYRVLAGTYRFESHLKL